MIGMNARHAVARVWTPAGVALSVWVPAGCSFVAKNPAITLSLAHGRSGPLFFKWSEHQHRPKTHDLHSDNCETLKRYFSGKWMDEITSGMVDDFKMGRLLEKRWGDDKERTVGNATVN